WHARAGGPHAEIVALDAAGELARGATAYVTLEPCAHQGKTGPCTEKLIKAGVKRVVAAMRDPNPDVSGRGFETLSAAGVEVRKGPLSEAAAALNPGFVSRMTTGQPYVRLKLAMSVDGRTALGSGESRWITGEDARRDVQRLRARSSAILTGVGTVLADNPRLDLRLADRRPKEDPERELRQPLRVIADSNLRTPPDARIFASGGPVLIATRNAGAGAAGALRAAGAHLLEVPSRSGRLDLAGLLNALGERQVNELHCECGATLAGALIAESLVDELVIYMAPSLLGDDGRPLAVLPGIRCMEDRIRLALDDTRLVGGDLRLRFRRVD
ncbi:MAG: bifunctional diaminohydroxyphosphoribosylaminopyrimidine deaminase/5-amino-6-(5-phosphoribosylamino)uracil reductase RibD, partial [Gammaproteobacteria bacterium]|nr:bifunctional diaminohydroxyphosphoribosylaminopyrimidine deaminase/5-amino-6-(5-phosphoribosylamino)uracil reductase RibD [Gammaproteobacteria bacterium]